MVYIPLRLPTLHGHLAHPFTELLRVNAGTETPYYYVGKNERTAYTRVGNSSVPCNSCICRPHCHTCTGTLPHSAVDCPRAMPGRKGARLKSDRLTVRSD